MILAMLALAAVTIVWGVVIVPVRNGLSSSRARYTEAVVRLGAAQAGLAQVKGLQRRAGAPVPLPLADAVRARADAAGLVLGSVEAEANDRVRVGVATARAGALMAWIGALERDGVLVETIAVTPDNAGAVSAQMTLRARAS